MGLRRPQSVPALPHVQVPDALFSLPHFLTPTLWLATLVCRLGKSATSRRRRGERARRPKPILAVCSIPGMAASPPQAGSCCLLPSTPCLSSQQEHAPSVFPARWQGMQLLPDDTIAVEFAFDIWIIGLIIDRLR